MRMRSIRRFLILTLLAAILVASAIGVVLSYQDAHHEIDELFDAQLAQSASLLLEQVSHELRENTDEGEESEFEDIRPRHPYEQKVIYQIRDREGRLLSRSSPDVPVEPLSSLRSGYELRRIKDVEWRVFSLWSDRSGVQIQVAQRHEIRAELAASIARKIIIPLLGLLPVLAILIAWIVGQGLKPLGRLRRQINARTPDNLEPVTLTQAPDEIRPLVDELNLLLKRLKASLDGERRFTADAAHELRTPLAALSAQLQVARDLKDESEKNGAIGLALIALKTLSHLVAQLLELARLDQVSRIDKMHEVDLRNVAIREISGLANFAVEKQVDLSLEAVPTKIRGDEFLLGSLVRNLIDNAIKFTGSGGHIVVTVTTENGRALLMVSDDGPGISESKKARIFERFYRGEPEEIKASGNRAGSGLGLSIVKQIADLHHAEISLTQGLGGKGVSIAVRFGLSS